ncbi:MAG: alpha/beta hydrolase [Bacillota bacterium]
MLGEIFDLEIEYEKNGLKAEKSAQLWGYVLPPSPPASENQKHPAVIICPGGGYNTVNILPCQPMAMSFCGEGISAFILDYSVTPTFFPTQLLEVATAVKFVRDNAEKFNIDPNKIAVAGFSAGGHLSASLGVFWNSEIVRNLGFKSEDVKPNALILGYPVLSARRGWDKWTFTNLLGEEGYANSELLASVSLENHVTKDVPPTFFWHTYEDQKVPVQNAMLFTHEVVEAGKRVELHVFPEGLHALGIANWLVMPKERIHKHVDSWLKMASNFVFQYSEM